MSPSLPRVSDGHGFVIGNTHIYCGPGVRGTKAPAILAFTRVGEQDTTVVADFRNATMAAKFIEALKLAIDEGTANKPLNAEQLVADLLTNTEGNPEE